MPISCLITYLYIIIVNLSDTSLNSLVILSYETHYAWELDPEIKGRGLNI